MTFTNCFRIDVWFGDSRQTSSSKSYFLKVFSRVLDLCLHLVARGAEQRQSLPGVPEARGPEDVLGGLAQPRVSRSAIVHPAPPAPHSGLPGHGLSGTRKGSDILGNDGGEINNFRNGLSGRIV